MKKRITIGAFVLFFLVSLCLGLVLLCDYWVGAARQEFIFDKNTPPPKTKTALVLGCAKNVNGWKNIYFTQRIKAAARLYKNGVVEYLIVSGEKLTTKPKT